MIPNDRIAEKLHLSCPGLFLNNEIEFNYIPNPKVVLLRPTWTSVDIVTNTHFISF